MKKYIIALIPTLLLLASCNNKNKTTVSDGSDDPASAYQLDLTIATPAGAPSACLYKYVSDESHVEVLANDRVSEITTVYMPNQSKDIVILPTNAGVQVITKKNMPYKIAANITFGNLFIAATGNDDDGVLDADDYVVLIQEGNVPDILFKYVYGDMGLTNTHYLTDASKVGPTLISGKNAEDNNAFVDYVLCPEPAFTAAKSKNSNVSQYASLQEEYKEKSGDKEITQASIFVSNSADKNKVDAFLNQLEKDINAFVTNPDVIDEYIKDFDDVKFASKFSVPNATLLKNITKNGNRMGMGFKNAKANKANIDQFLTLWPAIGETSEEIYY